MGLVPAVAATIGEDQDDQAADQDDRGDQLPEQVVVAESIHGPDRATAPRSVSPSLQRLARGSRRVVRVRLTEFWEQMNRQFGQAYAESVARDHVCSQLDGRTAAQAVEDGEPIRNVWLAICADFELPPRIR